LTFSKALTAFHVGHKVASLLAASPWSPPSRISYSPLSRPAFVPLRRSWGSPRWPQLIHSISLRSVLAFSLAGATAYA